MSRLVRMAAPELLGLEEGAGGAGALAVQPGPGGGEGGAARYPDRAVFRQPARSTGPTP